MTKLSPEQIEDLRNRYKKGEKVLDLVKEFNISNSTLYKNVKDLKRQTKPEVEKVTSSEEESETSEEETESSYEGSYDGEETEYELSEDEDDSNFIEQYDDLLSISEPQQILESPHFSSENVIRAKKFPKGQRRSN